jgi:hypothetical protein
MCARCSAMFGCLHFKFMYGSPSKSHGHACAAGLQCTLLSTCQGSGLIIVPLPAYTCAGKLFSDQHPTMADVLACLPCRLLLRRLAASLQQMYACSKSMAAYTARKWNDMHSVCSCTGKSRAAWPAATALHAFPQCTCVVVLHR